uniref:Putative reverse transcriptase domain-containing protein n=1 Tax=Tanacetum cinerariifolium TaxID=118510 RepID=A0A6L2JYH1_TANCI|nr:putative reverse transcriptase domain-containing protein [Tanacetum cinerariifolium]
MRQRRWIELFSDYDCEIRYNPAIREDYKMERLERLYISEIIERHESIGNETGFKYSLPSQNRWLNYHSSVKCAPFEALFGRKCQTPIAWVEVGESKLFGPEIIQETTDKIVQIKERLKTARDRQKSYADNQQKRLEFNVGDKVLLKVLPWKGVVRFGVHDTFHVSNLKKCLADTNLHVPFEEVKINYKLYFVEEPIEIMDREVKKLKRDGFLLLKFIGIPEED